MPEAGSMKRIKIGDLSLLDEKLHELVAAHGIDRIVQAAWELLDEIPRAAGVTKEMIREDMEKLMGKKDA